MTDVDQHCPGCSGWGEVRDQHRVIACHVCCPDAYEQADE